jgi:uncharacterized protein YfdQ (DUF2303 family)
MHFDRHTKERLGLLDYDSLININVIRFDPHSGIPHRKMILRLAEKAIDNHEKFITLVTLRRPATSERVIADFYNIDWNLIVEVAYSEDEISLERKRKIWEKLGFHFDVVRV